MSRAISEKTAPECASIAREVSGLDESNRFIRDLIALSTLPAAWMGAAPERIGESLLAAIDATINPVFSCIRLRLDPHAPVIELAYLNHAPASSPLAAELTPKLLAWAASHNPDEVLAIEDSPTGFPLYLCVHPLGSDLESGLLAIGFSHPAGPSMQQRTLLNVVANQAAIACQNTALHLQAQAARNDALALNEVARTLSAELSLHDVVQKTTDAATRLTGAKYGAFFYNVLDDQGQTLRLFTLSGASHEDFARFKQPRHTAIFGPILDGAGPVRIDDVLRDSRYGQMPPEPGYAGGGMPPGHLPVRSHLAVPVIARSGEVLGGLFFGHPEPAVFTEAHERLAVGIAAQAAIAIDNARLFDRAEKEIGHRQRTEQTLRRSQLDLAEELHAVERLQQVSMLLPGADDSQALCESIMDAAVAIMRSDFASLQMLHPERGPAGALRLLAFRGFNPAAAQFWEWVRPSSQSACGQALSTGQRCIVEDVETCPFMAGSEDLRISRDTGIRSAQSTPLLSRSGKIVGMISTHWKHPSRPSDRDLRLFDVLARQAADWIERIHNEQALRAAKEAAEAADRAKDRFLAVLSHELRTPLSPVVMTVAAMENDPELPATVREDAAMIRRNIELETRLIDDLLDLSRVTSGKMRLQIQPTAVHAALRQALHNCAAEIAAKNIQVHFDPRAAADRVHADPARLQQVFWNLLRNAAKFTPEHGAIFLHTENIETGIRIQVRDTGVGIGAEFLPHIFAAFEQGDLKTTRQFGGLGLGLAICKAVVDLHGGTITAASDGPGQGAVFTVELPTSTAAEPSAPRANSPAQRRPDARPISVLLVEDHPDTARVLSRLLERSGFRVQTAGSVRAALRSAAAEHFDILISDLGLPDGTGYDLMQEISQRHAIKGIALSGYGMEEDQRRSRACGFLRHIVKPVDVPQLESIIRDLAAAPANANA